MRLYFKYASIQLRSIMQYKVSFFFTILGQFLTSFGAFLSIYFMFARFNEVEGFSYSEVLLCTAVVLGAFSLAEIVFRGFDRFPSMIGNGEFDRIMVRPRNEIFQIFASKLELSRAGRLAQAIIIVCYAIPASGVGWTWDKVATLVLMFICGTILFGCLFLVYASFTFFTIEGLEFMNIFTDGGREFGAYPLSIYGKGVLRFMTYVIPMACFQYYPFLYVIGRTDNRFYMIVPLFSLLFFIPAYLFWRFGLMHYKSTGS